MSAATSSSNAAPKPGFRVADASSFAFATDLPPSSRAIHPSGVLHAFRTTATPAGCFRPRQEHAFAWIENALHIDPALAHLEAHGFDRANGITFVPYSTKRNWLECYPHAEPALECGEDGKVVVYLNQRPYPNGLGELETMASMDEGKKSAVAEGKKEAAPKEKKRKARTSVNMLHDSALLPDAERDELHIEIYNYLSWLHAKLDRLEKKAAYAKAAKAGAAPPLEGESAKRETRGRPKRVGLTELQGALDMLESAFLVVPNAKLEAAEAKTSAGAGVGDVPPLPEIEPPKRGRPKKDAPPRKTGAPLLEEVMGPTLAKLVDARESAGKKRRRAGSRKRTGWQLGSVTERKNKKENKGGESFDDMLGRLAAYKEAHGDCVVPKGHEDVELANWVRGIRERRANLRKKGKEVDDQPPEGKPLLARTLIAERVQQLDALGFAWSLAPPTVSWESRFAELIEYYNEHGRWPSQARQGLGCWVHKQRQAYVRKDKKFMQNRAPKLDEVGFEWTPRGNTKMSWAEGYEKLVAFGTLNGHFDVPSNLSDPKSDEHRLYNWVKSLSTMYRSYKLGRQCGSLNDERILELVKIGFVFKSD
ncbi:hypothetical protein ACHAXT_005921 [Thalassiosira profunda]